MSRFPEKSSYPLAYDNDRTLYLVYNTTETTITSNNYAWSDSIEIKPQEADKEEIWANNGFATIEGELFYYDAVEKNSDDRVFKLKKCLRNLAGKKTKFNEVGTSIRGFVVAQHHNNLVDAIINVEEFVGINFSEDESTLDWRIRNLNDEDLIFDDYGCPDVELQIKTISSSANTGTVIEYEVTINGSFGSFVLDFGDGSTTTERQGTHTYAPNAVIDPVVTVTSENCQIVQTPASREETREPEASITAIPFSVPVPIPPEIPSFNFPLLNIPSVDIAFPPLILPKVNIDPFSNISVIVNTANVPSLITISPVIPGFISITPNISLPSIISFLNVPSFSPIQVATPSFSPIQVATPSFSPVQFGPTPSINPIQFGPTPNISSIQFGPTPNISSIQFGPTPSINPIQFGPAPTVGPIEFGSAPSFSPIQFGPAPTIGPVQFGSAPSFSPIQFGSAPSFGPIQFGSAPSFGPIEFGPAPAIGPVQFGPAPNFGLISFAAVPSFSPIQFGPAPTFGPIQFGPAPTFGPIQFGTAPQISVFWGTPPSINCTCTIVCPSSSLAMNQSLRSRNVFGVDDVLDAGMENIELQYDMVGFPSEIIIRPPEIKPISVTHDIPSILQLKLLSPIPEEIKLTITESIPKEIKIVPPTREELQVISFSLPDIKFDTRALPPFIPLHFEGELPKVSFDISTLPELQVRGIPSVLILEHNLPSVIPVEIPSNAKIPVVFEGPPLQGELKVNWGLNNSFEDEEGRQCFMLVPCPRK